MGGEKNRNTSEAAHKRSSTQEKQHTNEGKGY